MRLEFIKNKRMNCVCRFRIIRYHLRRCIKQQFSTRVDHNDKNSKFIQHSETSLRVNPQIQCAQERERTRFHPNMMMFPTKINTNKLKVKRTKRMQDSKSSLIDVDPENKPQPDSLRTTTCAHSFKQRFHNRLDIQLL